MSNYYDPWAHSIQIFFTRLFQLILLTLILGFLIWYFLLSYYFEAGFWLNTKEAVLGDSKLIKSLFTMCFLCSGLISGWLFTFLMAGKSKTRDQHYRGSRMVD